MSECDFVEQLVDVHCRNLQLMRLQCARSTDLSEAEHKLNCCRQACCAQELCQIYVTNIHRARDDVENIVSCWMGNHTFVDCGSSSGGETALAMGWVGERAKTSSVYADDYLSHLLLTITGLQTDPQPAHPGTIHSLCFLDINIDNNVILIINASAPSSRSSFSKPADVALQSEPGLEAHSWHPMALSRLSIHHHCRHDEARDAPRIAHALREGGDPWRRGLILVIA